MPVLIDKRWKAKGHVALVRRAVRETLRTEGAPLSSEVSVVLADDEFIRGLNRQYMGIDASTDVLSFPQIGIPACDGPASLISVGKTEGPAPCPVEGYTSGTPVHHSAEGSGAERSETNRCAIGTSLAGARPGPLGDIVVSMEAVIRQASEHDVPVSKELALLVIHSTLHLLGYDHDTDSKREVMWKQQEHILSRLGSFQQG